MESIPRMPMLSVESKYAASANPQELGQKITEYISKFYQENGENYAQEIKELENLRESACKAPADFTGCSLLKKYYAQLSLLKNRFPMEANDEAAVTFIWFEKYSDLSNTVAVDDIRYEMSCILHNIGALHSYLGAVDTRSNSEGMKISCTHFQCAAYAFQLLKESPDLSASQFCTDFDPSILQWNFNLMMAQAQECILEKSLMDKRKCSIVAKIAVQVAEFYKECLKNLSNPNLTDIVDSSRCKTWKRFIEAKQKYYSAIAYFQNGLQYEPADENSKDLGQNIGERITYYQTALENLQSAAPYAKDSQQIREPLKFVESIVSSKLESTKKDNDFVFHEKIPDFSDLPEIKGASLVKPIPFDPLDVEISGPDIFQKLIPLSVHQSSSLYSEEKANLLRKINSQVEEKNQLLNDFLLTLQLEHLNLDSNLEEIGLPEKILECCAAFNAMPEAVPQLSASMNEISAIYRKVDAILNEFRQQLKDAESDLAVFEKIDDEKVQNLKHKLEDLKSQFKRFAEANNLATQSNKELQKAMAEHADNLKLLSAPLNELKKRLAECGPKIDQNCPESLELKKILSKIDEMKDQRRILLDDLRLQIINDDITKLLLANRQQDCKEIFDKQLAKHEKSIKILELNLNAQDNILKLLTEANARCGDFRRRTLEFSVCREEKIQQLIDSFNAYLDLKDKSQQGVAFYQSLQQNLKDFNEKLNKYGLEFNKFETEMTKKQATDNQDQGPKLKDYMAYYQAMKSGQQPTDVAPEPADLYFRHALRNRVLKPYNIGLKNLLLTAYPKTLASNIYYGGGNPSLTPIPTSSHIYAAQTSSVVAPMVPQQPPQPFTPMPRVPVTSNFGQFYEQQFPARAPYAPNPYVQQPYAPHMPGQQPAYGYNYPAAYPQQFHNMPAQQPMQNLMDQPLDGGALPPPMAPGGQ